MKFDIALTGSDLLFGLSIAVGTTFSFLLLLVKRNNWVANRFLGLILLTIVLWMSWALAMDINLDRYFPHWSWLPWQFSLTIGPLLYFYVQRLTQPDTRFRAGDLIHFSPLLLEQSVQLAQIFESHQRQLPTYATTIFDQFNPVLQLLAIISVLVYLHLSLKRLKTFDYWLTEQVSDLYRYESRWLQRLLIGFGVLWAAWIPFVLVDYFWYQYQLPIASYYPLYLLLASMTIWIGVEAFLRPELILIETPKVKPALQPPAAAQVVQQIAWLRLQLASNLFYLDASLTLSSLADALQITAHELSRIINVGTGKNFNDFINEYRVNEVIRKLQDPAYHRITLLGIGYDSGFNSKTTFNRTFKQITGQSPLSYKNSLKKATTL